MTGMENNIQDSADSHRLDVCQSSSAPKTTPTVQVTMPQQQRQPNRDEYERLFGVDELLDKQPTTTRRELWSYYLYYNGESTCSWCVVDNSAQYHQVTMELARGHTVKHCRFRNHTYTCCVRTLLAKII